MKPHFDMLAAYNRWANVRLYAVAASLSDADYRADRGVFFKSMQGTLNHLLAADRVWMSRFTSEGEAPSRLDDILFESLVDLREAREREDQRIIAFVNDLDETRLGGTIRYRAITRPETYEQELAPALTHFFNHQTHHRGQAHALLTGLGIEAPSFDLILYQRETDTGGRRIS